MTLLHIYDGMNVVVVTCCFGARRIKRKKESQVFMVSLIGLHLIYVRYVCGVTLSSVYNSVVAKNQVVPLLLKHQEAKQDRRFNVFTCKSL